MKPLPKITAESRPFWDGCLAHELRYQRCANCGLAQFPPANACAKCYAQTLAWETSTGMGVVSTRTTVYRAPTAEFRGDTPYVLALVDIDEGFRMMMNVRNSAPEAVAIGSRIRVIYEETERGDVVLPQAELV